MDDWHTEENARLDETFTAQLLSIKLAQDTAQKEINRLTKGDK